MFFFSFSSLHRSALIKRSLSLRFNYLLLLLPQRRSTLREEEEPCFVASVVERAATPGRLWVPKVPVRPSTAFSFRPVAGNRPHTAKRKLNRRGSGSRGPGRAKLNIGVGDRGSVQRQEVAAGQTPVASGNSREAGGEGPFIRRLQLWNVSSLSRHLTDVAATFEAA